MRKTPQHLRDAQAARRKAEIASGIRTDRRFVGKVFKPKIRKRKEKLARVELRNQAPTLRNGDAGVFLFLYLKKIENSANV